MRRRERVVEGEIYRTSAAPKMTMKAAIMEPEATPNVALAAPPAGGASADPAVAAGVPEPLVLVDDPPVADDAPLEKLALGPMALFDTVLTVPEIVARLLCTLAMAEADELPASVALLLDGEEDDAGFWGKVTWMRICSHWSPIHSSYRL
jgi:hypothetical protein